jgi:Right handed beta helix region
MARPRPLRRLAALAGLLLAIAAGSDSAFAANLYVDKDSVGGACSDARPPAQVSATAPWCSLDRAAHAAPAGSTVVVRRGAYPRLVIQDVPRSNFVTFVAFSGEQPSVDGFQTQESSHLRFQGFRITDYNLVYSGSDHIQFIGNDITANTTVRPSTNTLFQGNHVHHTPVEPDDPIAGVGLWVVAGGGSVNGVTVRNNHFEHLPNDALFISAADILVEGNRFEHIQSPDNNYAHADVIQCMGCNGLIVRGNYASDNDSGILNSVAESNNWVIENNMFVRCASQPLQLDNENRDLIVRSNTFQDCGNGALFRWDPAFSQNPQGFVIANNIFDGLYIDPRLKIAVEDYNLIREGDAEDYGPHSIVGRSPIFVKPGAGDYRLAPRSPGIDAGSSEFAPGLDIFGGVRPEDDPEVPNRGGGTPPFYDIGAHERLSKPPAGAQPALPGPGRRARRLARLRIKRVQSLRGGLVVHVRCRVRCRITARARVWVRGAPRRSSASRAARRAVSSRRVSRRLRADRRTRVVLRFRLRARRQLRRALRRRGALPGVVALAAKHGGSQARMTRRLRVRR